MERGAARQAGGFVAVEAGAIAVAIAAFANMVTKGALAFSIGGAAMAWRLTAVLRVSSLVGALAFLWGGAPAVP